MGGGAGSVSGCIWMTETFGKRDSVVILFTALHSCVNRSSIQSLK